MNTNDPTNIPDLNFPSFTADAQVALESLKRAGAELAGTAPLATGGPIPPQLTVADLSAKHIGERVRITNHGNTHTGRVSDLRFETEPTYDGACPVAVEVTFRDGAITYPLNAAATVLT